MLFAFSTPTKAQILRFLNISAEKPWQVLFNPNNCFIVFSVVIYRIKTDIFFSRMLSFTALWNYFKQKKKGLQVECIYKTNIYPMIVFASPSRQEEVIKHKQKHLIWNVPNSQRLMKTVSED